MVSLQRKASYIVSFYSFVNFVYYVDAVILAIAVKLSYAFLSFSRSHFSRLRRASFGRHGRSTVDRDSRKGLPVLAASLHCSIATIVLFSRQGSIGESRRNDYVCGRRKLRIIYIENE